MDGLEMLREQGVDGTLVRQVEEFRREHAVAEEVRDRVLEPALPFFGREILEMAIAALLQGENLLLTGAKATGKNILAENLAWLFGRPAYFFSCKYRKRGADRNGYVRG